MAECGQDFGLFRGRFFNHTQGFSFSPFQHRQECRLRISSMVRCAVIWIPASSNFSSTSRKYDSAMMQLRKWHLIFESVQCRIGIMLTRSSSLDCRNASSTRYLPRLACTIASVLKSARSVIRIFLPNLPRYTCRCGNCFCEIPR